MFTYTECLKISFTEVILTSREKLLYLQPNANSVNTPIEQQLIETRNSVTTVLPPVENSILNANENNHS
jgi:hypothetical protein